MSSLPPSPHGGADSVRERGRRSGRGVARQHSYAAAASPHVEGACPSEGEGEHIPQREPAKAERQVAAELAPGPAAAAEYSTRTNNAFVHADYRAARCGVRGVAR